MALDRSLQEAILRELQEVYPALADIDYLLPGADRSSLIYNLFYLREHGLIAFNFSRLMNGAFSVAPIAITAAGIDFIADDGGLSAILSVVTIRLHEDTIRDLLVSRVTSSGASDTVKAKLIDRIKGLPAEALTRVSLAAIQQGLDHLPNAIEWLERLTGHGHT